MQVKCDGAVRRYQSAEENSSQRENAYVEIRHCMATQVMSCQEQADRFLKSFTESEESAKQAEHFASMNACVERFTTMMNKVLARASMQRETEQAHGAD